MELWKHPQKQVQILCAILSLAGVLVPWQALSVANIRVDNKLTRPPITKNYTAGAARITCTGPMIVQFVSAMA